MVDKKLYCTNNKRSKNCKELIRFDEYEQFNKLKPEKNSEGRVKLTDQEKEQIRKEFLTGIPIQRIYEIINYFNSITEDDFIIKLQSYYNKMVEENLLKLSCGVSHIDNIIKGFENAVYLDRSISLKSIKKLELLLNRKIQVIKNWRKPRRKRLSGVRIQITEDGIEIIKDILNSGILIKRVSEIIKEYQKEDNFIRYLRKIYILAFESDNKEVKIPLTQMGKFITNWENILYRGYVISKTDFNKLRLLIGKENSIAHKEVFGRRNLEAVKLIKNKAHAELVGTFIMRGSIRTERRDLYFSFKKDDHNDYIAHLKKLIKRVFGRTPSMMQTRDRFYLSGPEIIQYLTSQGLSNQNRRVPSWILKSPSWIQDNKEKWEKEYAPLVIACLRGMINASGSIRVASSQDRIEISLSKANIDILKDSKLMCDSLGIRTSKIKQNIRENGRVGYYIYIISRDQVRKFLIDIIKPEKWDYVKDTIEKILIERGTSINLVLEITPEFNELRRKLFQHQKQQYSFLYNPIRIKKINNKTFRDCYSKYIKNISIDHFPSEEFEVKTNIRPSKLKIAGEHLKDKHGKTIFREVIKTEFIYDNLIKNNPNIQFYHYNELSPGFYRNILDEVRKVYAEFRDKNLGKPWHEPILKKIMLELPEALASEVPVWKKLKNGKYYIGHVDLNLFYDDAFFIADLKDDEIDIIKSLAQITSYGINQKRLILNKMKNIDNKFKCIAFTKDELWVFNPESLKHDIIKFIKYANSLRDQNLKSLPFSKGLKRTDLLEDIEKVVSFLQRYVNDDENNEEFSNEEDSDEEDDNNS